MTQKRILIPIIAVLFAVGIQQAYAELDQNEVPFDFDFKSCQRSTLVTEAGEFDAWYCTYLGGIPTGTSIKETVPLDGKSTIEITIDETEISDDATVTTSKPEPVIKTEQQIKVEGIITAREQLESYWKGTKTIQELCFGGTERESRIFEQYATIDVKRPNDNRPLQSNPQYKYEMILSEICKAEYVLNFKINNPSRTLPGEGEQTEFIVRSNFDGLIWDDTEGLDNPTYAFEERHMTAFNFDKSIQVAGGFQCSKPGKQQGHCSKEIGDQLAPEPKSYMSKQGKSNLAEWQAYLETGVTELPFKEPDKEFVPTTALDQYIKAYGISEEALKEWFESRSP